MTRAAARVDGLVSSNKKGKKILSSEKQIFKTKKKKKKRSEKQIEK
jgi:hypothetical protein